MLIAEFKIPSVLIGLFAYAHALYALSFVKMCLKPLDSVCWTGQVKNYCWSCYEQYSAILFPVSNLLTSDIPHAQV